MYKKLETWRPTGGDRAFFGDVHAKLVREAAAKRGVSIEMIDSKTFFLNYQDRKVLFVHHLPCMTSAVARYVSNDKHTTKIFLERVGVKTPPGNIFPVNDTEMALSYARSIGFPVVIKPLSGSGGKGVTSNILDEEHFKFAWSHTTSGHSRLVVEKHVHGNDYRILVINGRFVCATQRVPVNVTGDGISNVIQLIEKKNQRRAINPYVGSKKVLLTSEMKRILKGLGFNESSIIPKGLNVQLLPVANIGTGGDSKDVTDKIHPGFIDIAIKAAHAIPEVFFAGVDLLARDITSSPDSQEYAICEVNTRPDIGMHHFPVIGRRLDAAGVLIESIFPGAIPVATAAMKKVELRLRGDVIGVGLRKYILKIASLNHIRGWVKNEIDEVSAVLCGSESAIDRVLLVLKERKSMTMTAKRWKGKVPSGFEIML